MPFVHVFLLDLNRNLRICQQILMKPTIIKLHTNPLSGSRVVIFRHRNRQTDRQYEAKRHIFAIVVAISPGTAIGLLAML
jgi:hypothetical protein